MHGLNIRIKTEVLYVYNNTITTSHKVLNLISTIDYSTKEELEINTVLNNSISIIPESNRVIVVYAY